MYRALTVPGINIIRLFDFRNNIYYNRYNNCKSVKWIDNLIQALCSQAITTLYIVITVKNYNNNNNNTHNNNNNNNTNNNNNKNNNKKL